MSKGIKAAIKKKPVWNKGLTRKDDERLDKMFINKDLSYLNTEEYKEKRSKAMKGLFWYNNGSENIRIRDGEPIPSGFTRGMIGKRQDDSKCSKQCKNTRTGQTFESVTEASTVLNCTENAIIRSCESDTSYACDRDGKEIGRFEYI